MNIYNILKQKIEEILRTSEDFAVETPRAHGYGDVSTNAPMVLAKKLGEMPLDLASKLAFELKKADFIERVEVAGAGFVNIFLKREFLYKAFEGAVEPGFGLSGFGRGKKINVEYCSANPTGPVHIGHTRCTIYGDVLAEMLAQNGFDVTREFYVNDAGGQIETLVRSVFARYRQLLGEDAPIPEGCYPGEYLIDVAKLILEEFGRGLLLPKDFRVFREVTVKNIMDGIKADLLKIKVRHDVFTYESSLIQSGKVEKAVEVLRQKGLLYKGVLPEPKGKKGDEWEPREQTLFMATRFGDTEDRALKKSDGSNTYFTSDIAYHKNKLDRGFYDMVLVLGADHIGYVSRIIAATKAVSDKPDLTNLTVKACQIVKFMEDGKPVKMSKRSGTFSSLADVCDEVEPDILRFMLLTKKNDSQMDFDIAAVKAQTKENPIFYIQYAYSRGSSLIRKAGEILEKPNLNLLSSEAETSLIKKILEYPKVMESSVKKMEPHNLAFYLYELASELHSFWNLGNEHPELRFIIEGDKPLTSARIFLVKSVLNVIASAFKIFKISPMERM